MAIARCRQWGAMSQGTFDAYVKNRYEVKIAWYNHKAIANQRIYRWLQWGILVLAAVTPILVAVGGEWLRWSAVVIASLVAIGTAALKAFKYQENWINYRTTCETLRKEIHFFDARVGEYRTAEDPSALFVERVEALISRENTLWLTTRTDSTEEQKQ